MKNKKVQILAVIFSLVIIAVFSWVLITKPYKTGSTSSPQNSDNANYTNPDDGKEVSGIKITEPAKLEELWSNYIVDTIANLTNNGSFNSPKEIKPIHIIQYCYNRYVAENGVKDLEPMVNGSGYLFPLKIANTYAKRYFDIDSIDVSNIGPEYFISDKQEINMTAETRDHWATSYTQNNSWGLRLSEVTKNSDDTYKVIMVSYDNYETRRIEMTYTYFLKARNDGSLYFTKSSIEWVNNNLVKITGSYKGFKEIKGYSGDLDYFTLAGEINGNPLFYSIYNGRNTIELLLVDIETMTVKKSFVAADNVKDYYHYFYGVNVFSDNIVVKLKDKLVIVDGDLKSKREIKFSGDIKEELYGMDVNKDLSKFVYSDKEGLKLLDAQTGQVTVLLKSTETESPVGKIQTVFSFPHLTANETKIMATILVYEGTGGVILYDLQSGTEKKILDDGMSLSVEYNTGILEVNGFDSKDNKYKTRFYDFSLGKALEIPLDNIENAGLNTDPSLCYTSRNYSAFVDSKGTSNDRADIMYYINRLDNKTLKLDTRIISVKAAMIRILGVTDDGRIIFYYYYNPAEKGIGVTTKP